MNNSRANRVRGDGAGVGLQPPLVPRRAEARKSHRGKNAAGSSGRFRETVFRSKCREDFNGRMHGKWDMSVLFSTEDIKRSCTKCFERSCFIFLRAFKMQVSWIFWDSDFETETMEMKKRDGVWPLEIIDKVLFLRTMRGIDLEIGFKMELSTFSIRCFYRCLVKGIDGNAM